MQQPHIVKATGIFNVTDFKQIKIQLLNWANQFGSFCLLDSHGYEAQEPAGFECLLAAGSLSHITLPAGTINAFDALQQFASEQKGQWLFGHLAYDAGNENDQQPMGKADGIGFADAHFFVPELVLKLCTHQLHIYCAGDAAAIYSQVLQASKEPGQVTTEKVHIQSRMSQAQYIATIQQLQAHIVRGDCYEINFCQEFFAKASINPVAAYQALSNISPVPFAALYKINHQFCICASPERYLKKYGTRLLSQPIKGTAKRNHQDAAADSHSKEQLRHSKKEQSENVMVVDLVRNDLSRVCKPGTVNVDELFAVYSFAQVHQMISTISGAVNKDVSWVKLVRETFPMGSMTGAPKRRVMQLIQQYEQTRRGLFSGTIGYIDPAGDFDFNVVIRSILYNQQTSSISLQAGSAITFYCNAQEEYNECLLKAKSMMDVFAG
ncbi:MAG: hypothetical protein RL172_1732 [Bacteroidota bacterium]